MISQYIQPKKLNEALEQIATFKERAKIFAGGTDLIIQMRKGLINPEVVIDISSLKELRGINTSQGVVSIGALTTYYEIINDPTLIERASVLVQATRAVGSAQIRSRGTLGGNLGNGSPAGDSIPSLFVLNADVHLLSIEGDRWIPILEFFKGPGKTVRQMDEIISEIRFDIPTVNSKGYSHKIGQRKGMFIAKASVAMQLSLMGGIVQDCAIALGAVAPTVIRVPATEQFLIHKNLNGEIILQASQMTAEGCHPITDIRSTDTYRRKIIGVMVKRGLEELALRNN
jgi:CO/xanthine dehydrogenase FAD-binding subunit